MLIDDDEVVRILLTRVVENAGCTVISCSSIKSALGNLKQSIPDLVILDLNMPDLDGFNFLKFRQINQKLSAIPVLVLSGTKRKEDVDKALSMGADQFLEKPLNSRLVLEKMQKILTDNFLYIFPEDGWLEVEAEITAKIIARNDTHLKIISQVRLSLGKPVEIIPKDDVIKNEISVIFKTASDPVKTRDGLFATIISAIGLDARTKILFEKWLRGDANE